MEFAKDLFVCLIHDISIIHISFIQWKKNAEEQVLVILQI